MREWAKTTFQTNCLLELPMEQMSMTKRRNWRKYRNAQMKKDFERRAKKRLQKQKLHYTEAGPVTVTTGDGKTRTKRAYTPGEMSSVLGGHQPGRRSSK